MEASGNSTIINPSAYSIEQPQNGWYQVFSDGAAQSSYSSEYIPPVIDQPIFGYGAYTGFAQSIVNGSKFTIPVNPIHNGRTRIEFNLLFSPLGGNLSIDIGNNVFIVNTLSNRSYYGWYGINDSSRIGSLNIVDVQGIQSINQIVLSNLSSYNYLVKLANNVLNKAPYHVPTLLFKQSAAPVFSMIDWLFFDCQNWILFVCHNWTEFTCRLHTEHLNLLVKVR